VWLLYVASALLAGLMAILRPPLDALVPRLVERRELAAASALYGAVRNAAGLGGPALAGVMIALAGFPATYGIDALTFLVSPRRCGGCALRRRRRTRSRRAGAASSRACASRARSRC
jgi:MFS family permease